MLPPQEMLGPQGPPPGMEPPPGMALPPEEEGPEDSEEILRDMLDLARDFIEVDGDEEDILEMEKVTSLIQKILANNQKAEQEMMDGKLTPRGVRRTLG